MRLRLEELMADRRVNQSQVAEGIGVTKAAVSRWGVGKGFPNPEMLEALAAFFEIGFDELLEAESKETPTGKTWKDFRNLAAA